MVFFNDLWAQRLNTLLISVKQGHTHICQFQLQYLLISGPKFKKKSMPFLNLLFLIGYLEQFSYSQSCLSSTSSIRKRDIVPEIKQKTTYAPAKTFMTDKVMWIMIILTVWYRFEGCYGFRLVDSMSYQLWFSELMYIFHCFQGSCVFFSCRVVKRFMEVFEMIVHMASCVTLACNSKPILYLYLLTAHLE